MLKLPYHIHDGFLVYTLSYLSKTFLIWGWIFLRGDIVISYAFEGEIWYNTVKHYKTGLDGDLGQVFHKIKFLNFFYPEEPATEVHHQPAPG